MSLLDLFLLGKGVNNLHESTKNRKHGAIMQGVIKTGLVGSSLKIVPKPEVVKDHLSETHIHKSPVTVKVKYMNSSYEHTFSDIKSININLKSATLVSSNGNRNSIHYDVVDKFKVE